MLDAIEQKLQMLARQTALGRRREDLAPGLRSFPAGNYVVFYRPLSEGIEVVRILSGLRDIEGIFRSSDPG